MNLIIGYLTIGALLTVYEYCELIVVAKKLNINLNNCTTLSKKDTIHWILGIPFVPVTILIQLVSRFIYSFMSDENKNLVFKQFEIDANEDKDLTTIEDRKLLEAIWKKQVGYKEYWK